jgi:hypothetical protein
MKRKPPRDNAIEIGKRLAARSRARGTDNDGQKQPEVWLPSYENSVRIVSNHLARSSLFSPIAHRQRKIYKDAVLVSRRDARIRYTGEQLDEADCDLLMQIMHVSRAAPLGNAVTINRGALLSEMGRTTGRSDYEWLRRRILALAAATLHIETFDVQGRLKNRVGDTQAFHLVGICTTENQAQYAVSLDPRWLEVFGNREYAKIDLSKRLALGRGNGMAKCLQRLLATSSDRVQRFSLVALKDKTAYSGALRDFRYSIQNAIAQLSAVGIILVGYFGKSTRGLEQLTIVRYPSAEESSG